MLTAAAAELHFAKTHSHANSTEEREVYMGSEGEGEYICI